MNALELNQLRTVETRVDFRLLGNTLSQDLNWSSNAPDHHRRGALLNQPRGWITLLGRGGL